VASFPIQEFNSKEFTAARNVVNSPTSTTGIGAGVSGAGYFGDTGPQEATNNPFGSFNQSFSSPDVLQQQQPAKSPDVKNEQKPSKFGFTTRAQPESTSSDVVKGKSQGDSPSQSQREAPRLPARTRSRSSLHPFFSFEIANSEQFILFDVSE